MMMRWNNIVRIVVVVIMSMSMSIVLVEGGEEQVVPCYFIFGDSLVDSGNNNQLLSLAKANYFPYGIDFPAGTTGRFSNGKTTVDVIAELLGFESYIASYATAKGQDILKGVNYASAAAGIRDETGRQLGGLISFSEQVQNYEKTVSELVNLQGDGNTSTSYYLSKCIYSISIGSNDYLNNYFMPQFYSTSTQFTPQQYARVLIQAYAHQLRILYKYGARKVALFGIGQIGCAPYYLARESLDGKTCVSRINSANQLFNVGLKSLVDQLNNQLPDANFIYINTYDILQDIITNPSSYGLRVTNAGCCGVGRNSGLITCLPLQPSCSNREEFLFWDAYHPTDAGNTAIGRRAYTAQSPSDAYPFDISHLAQI